MRVAQQHKKITLDIMTSVVTVVAAEEIQRSSSTKVITWLQTYQAQFIENCVIILAVLMLIESMFRKNAQARIVTFVLFSGIAYISIVKRQYLGESLLPGDIYFIKQLYQLFKDSYSSIVICTIIISAVLVIVASAVLYWKYCSPKNKYNPWRAVSVTISISALCVFVFYRHLPVALQKLLKIDT
jgi:hypothetical protein